MNHDRLNKRTEMLLRKSRTFERPHGNSNTSPSTVTAVIVTVIGAVSFFFLFIVISSMFEETSETLNSKRFFTAFLLLVFQLAPALMLAFSIYSEARKVYGTWISTKRTLFHLKPNGEYTAIDWNDVQKIEKDGPNLVFQGRHRKVTVLASGISRLPSEFRPYLWFLNRLIEDYGSDREGSEPLHELRKKIVCPFLHPCARTSYLTIFFAVSCFILPCLLAIVGIPVFFRELEAGRDPAALLVAIQLLGALIFVSPFLVLIPFSIRHRQICKLASEVYDSDVLPRLKEPLPRVSWNDFEKWQFGRRRHVFSRYQSDEKIEQFLATIPPPPRSISPMARRRFLISGGTLFFTALSACFISFCMGFVLSQGTEDSIREARFWNWTLAGTGTIVQAEPVNKKHRDSGAMYHSHDQIKFSYRHSDGKETEHLDVREFTKGVYTVGQSVPIRAFRGDERFLRLDSSKCYDSSIALLIIPAILVYCIIIIVLWISSFSEGPKKIRYWETASTTWGKVIDANFKGTTIRLAESEGENATIFCPNVVYLGSENLWRPLAVFLDPENPKEGTTIQPLPFGLRINPESGELVVDSKTLWAWPLVAGMVLLALVLTIFAALKFFAM